MKTIKSVGEYVILPLLLYTQAPLNILLLSELISKLESSSLQQHNQLGRPTKNTISISG